VEIDSTSAEPTYIPPRCVRFVLCMDTAGCAYSTIPVSVYLNFREKLKESCSNYPIWEYLRIGCRGVHRSTSLKSILSFLNATNGIFCLYSKRNWKYDRECMIWGIRICSNSPRLPNRAADFVRSKLSGHFK